MIKRYQKLLKSLLLQVIIVLAFVISLNYFQTRTMASGQAVKFELKALTEDAAWVPAGTGNNPSLIYFFAPWCRVCKLSMSNLSELRVRMPDVTIQVVALDYESKEEVLNFVSEVGISVPVYFGHEDVRRAWRINAYPSYYVLDKNSVIKARAVGYSSKYGMMAKVFWSKWFG